MKIWLVFLLLLLPQTVFAAESTGLLVPTLKMIGALALVIGLLLLLFAASKKGFRFLPMGQGQEGTIRVLETRPLGGKKFLCLVKVRDQELLLGLSHDRIEYLSQIKGTQENFEDNLRQEMESNG